MSRSCNIDYLLCDVCSQLNETEMKFLSLTATAGTFHSVIFSYKLMGKIDVPWFIFVQHRCIKPSIQALPR